MRDEDLESVIEFNSFLQCDGETNMVVFGFFGSFCCKMESSSMCMNLQ